MSDIFKVSQGFGVIALLGMLAVAVIVLSFQASALRNKIVILLGVRKMKFLVCLLQFGVCVCMAISALSFVGVNDAFRKDSDSPENCIFPICEKFAGYNSETVGQIVVENPKTFTIEQFDLIRSEDYGPQVASCAFHFFLLQTNLSSQAGWFIMLLLNPFGLLNIIRNFFLFPEFFADATLIRCCQWYGVYSFRCRWTPLS